MFCILLLLFNQVKHFQALSAPQLEPWRLIRHDGLVKSAHCTWMAGLEACSHTEAALYYIKAVSRFNHGQASTDVQDIWLPAKMCHARHFQKWNFRLQSPKEQSAFNKKRCNWWTSQERRSLPPSGRKQAVHRQGQPYSQWLKPTMTNSSRRRPDTLQLYLEAYQEIVQKNGMQ